MLDWSCRRRLFSSLPLKVDEEEIFPSVHEVVKVAAEHPFLSNSYSSTNGKISFIGQNMDLIER